MSHTHIFKSYANGSATFQSTRFGVAETIPEQPEVVKLSSSVVRFKEKDEFIDIDLTKDSVTVDLTGSGDTSTVYNNTSQTDALFTALNGLFNSAALTSTGGIITKAIKTPALANNTQAVLFEGITADVTRGKVHILASNTVINSAVDPIITVGYNMNSDGTEVVPGEGGVALQIEGNYNDGTAQRKMEAYFQFVWTGGYMRALMMQFNKVTHLVTIAAFYTDEFKVVAANDLPSHTFSKNVYHLYPSDIAQDTKMQLHSATGHGAVISQGYNGADDKWIQYHLAVNLYRMILNGKAVGDWSSQGGGSGSGPAVLKLNADGSASSVFGLHVDAPNLTAGQGAVVLIGKGEDTNNSGYIGYKYSANNSTANAMYFGFYANDDLMRLFATGNLVLGTMTDSPKALLSLNSTTKAFLPPRMTKVQRDAITSPPAGSVVYQTDNTPGIRTFNGTNWMRYTETAD